MSSPKEKRVRTVAAWICMLAVALLYAPLGAAALMANGVGCCASGYCPVKEHHHQKQRPAGTHDSAPMDCGHDMSGMTACSMSCCQDPGRPAVTPGAFVLPAPATVPAVGEVVRPVLMISSLEISQLMKPLSPPPRFGSQAR